MQFNFEWDPGKARENRQKHGVSFEQAAELFADPLALTLIDADHSTSAETRWVTLGGTTSGQLLVIVHTFAEEGDVASVRIISARNATRRERDSYEER